MNHIKYIFLATLLILTATSHAAPPDIIEFPQKLDVTLENGLRVILMQHHEQPTISYRLLIKTGTIDNPIGKEGLAEMTAWLLKAETSSKTHDQIIDTMALIGSSINIHSRSHYTTVSLDVLKRYSQIGFDIFTDIILNPTFPQKEIKLIRKELINHTKLELTSNNQIAINHGKFLLFGPKHPLGRIKTEKSLKSINKKDIKNFYHKFFHPSNSTLLVIGDFSKQQMLDELKNKFQQWKKNEPTKKIDTKPDFSKKGKMVVVNKPKTTQAVIYLRQWAISNTHKDYYAYHLMNYILGNSSFSSRLMDAVRAEGGKTYHISSNYINNFNYGSLAIITSTQNQQLVNTYHIIQDELKKLIDNGITQEELNKAKTYKQGSIPLQLESPSQIADMIINAIANERTIDDLSKQIVNYNAVKLQDVNRLIKQYLKPEIMNLVIVGDEKKLRQQLKQIAPYKKVNYKNPPVK